VSCVKGNAIHIYSAVTLKKPFVTFCLVVRSGQNYLTISKVISFSSGILNYSLRCLYWFIICLLFVVMSTNTAELILSMEVKDNQFIIFHLKIVCVSDQRNVWKMRCRNSGMTPLWDDIPREFKHMVWESLWFLLFCFIIVYFRNERLDISKA